jgi:hypothetical protein
MSSWRVSIVLLLIGSSALAFETRLPFSTVFKGRDQFDRLVAAAKSNNWKSLPIGQRTAAVGQALLGTRYKHFTLEIDNRIEAPSVNFQGMDCWTFFEISLAVARMLSEPETNWTPDAMLHYIEIDRYRGGECTGEYLSRLHYLEDWLYDNNQRGLVEDLTRKLGGSTVPHSAREMTLGWRHYRYLLANRALLVPLGRMEADVSSRPLYQITERRHHRDHLTRSKRIIFDVACWSCVANRRRRLAFHACFRSWKLRTGGRRLAPFDLSCALPLG